jgi:hypothetical protein
MWRYAVVGGVGGLAPFGCQVLALFLPNLVGGWDRYPQSMLLLPHTFGQWLVMLSVLAVVFAIAAGVVYATLDRRAKETMAKAFLVGVSVPGMILSLANGTSNGIKSPPPTVAAEVSGDGGRFVPASWRAEVPILATGTRDVAVDSGIGRLRLLVQCPDCPSGMSPQSLINRLDLTIAGGQTQAVSLPSGKTVDVAVPSAGRTVLTVLGHDKAPPANAQIWETAQVRFVTKPGENWQIEIILRQGVWNNVRAFLALSPYFVIDSIKAVRAPPGRKA